MHYKRTSMEKSGGEIGILAVGWVGDEDLD